MKSQSIYEYNQPEVLGEVQHVLVNLDPQMAGQDSGEENECDAQGDAEEFKTNVTPKETPKNLIFPK